MSALDLATDCALCGAMGKGDWCGDDREEPDTTGWLCPCEAAYSHKNVVMMMSLAFALPPSPDDSHDGSSKGEESET